MSHPWSTVTCYCIYTNSTGWLLGSGYSVVAPTPYITTLPLISGVAMGRRTPSPPPKSHALPDTTPTGNQGHVKKIQLLATFLVKPRHEFCKPPQRPLWKFSWLRHCLLHAVPERVSVILSIFFRSADC